MGFDRPTPSKHLHAAPSAAAVLVLWSTGGSIDGFRFLKFGTILCDDQRINGKFLVFGMDGQLEAVREERLKHMLGLKLALIRTKLVQCFEYRAIHFRLNVESFGAKRARCS